MISQYIYISTAPNLPHEEVQSILDACARNNAEHGVTGVLLYNGRNFLQLLEGKRETLDSLMTRIEADDRHAGVSMLHRSEVEERVCPDWAMRRIAIADRVDVRRQQIDDELPDGLDAVARKLILNFAVLN